MRQSSAFVWLAVLVSLVNTGWAEDIPKPVINAALQQQILQGGETLKETQKLVSRKVRPVPMSESVADWEKYRDTVRQEVLDNVVFRGVPDSWKEGSPKVEWLEDLPGGPGYSIKKLRYEALPGLWIPALLYVPEKLEGQVPVVLNVNGHDREGKAADYKQLRCINQAKRGMLALNPEWLGMGQLQTTNFVHYRMNQLDLCGTAGLAPFYLAMQRGLDVLLQLPHADPKRVAVAGLSGGGWQTIVISSLDQRVTLSNPVAGYSGFLTRAENGSDLGDSEQTPTDLGKYGDYLHLTMLRAPRPTLLTYNAKDNCCFAAPHALPPLLDAALPIYKLYGKPEALRSHINEDPGDHNFGLDNRQALYRMLGDFFYPDQTFDAMEIPSQDEVKTREVLDITLPADNADFHTLALQLSTKLPTSAAWPTQAGDLAAWQAEHRKTLRNVLNWPDVELRPQPSVVVNSQKVKVQAWRLDAQGPLSTAAYVFETEKSKGTTVVLGDAGRGSLTDDVVLLLERGQRVVAFDPFYFGECKLGNRDFLYDLMVATVGERPLGWQAAQVAAVTQWAQTLAPEEPITIEAFGPRTCLMALCAVAGSELKASVTLHDSFASLKDILDRNIAVNEMPELFCFGLLQATDVSFLTAACVPRQVRFVSADEKLKETLAPVGKLYQQQGVEFNPFE